MTDAETIQSLIQESAAGSAEAFRTLVETFEGKLFSYLSIRSHSRDDAKDMLQEVYIDLWRALPRFAYTSDAGFYKFLYTIAKRKMYKVWSKPTVGSLEEMEMNGQEVSSDDHTEERLSVQSAVMKLDGVARDIVTFKNWSGYTFGEIAEMLSMKETAVRVRYHRALIKMRETLHIYE